MRKTKLFAVIATLATIATATVTANASLNRCAYYDGLYAKVMRIEAVYHRQDILVMTDCNGYIWTAYGVEDWEPGDYAACIMDTCGTNDITDDVILSMKYERVDLF